MNQWGAVANRPYRVWGYGTRSVATTMGYGTRSVPITFPPYRCNPLNPFSSVIQTNGTWCSAGAQGLGGIAVYRHIAPLERKSISLSRFLVFSPSRFIGVIRSIRFHR